MVLVRDARPRPRLASDSTRDPRRLELPEAFQDVRARSSPGAPEADAEAHFDALIDELGRLKEDFEALDRPMRTRTSPRVTQ